MSGSRVQKWLTLAAIAALLAGAPGCCTHAGALRRARIHAAVNRAHASDKALPRQAREIASDNADAWEVQAWSLGGPQPPRATIARIKSQAGSR